jgi:hypothetical protein
MLHLASKPWKAQTAPDATDQEAAGDMHSAPDACEAVNGPGKMGRGLQSAVIRYWTVVEKLLEGGWRSIECRDEVAGMMGSGTRET